MTEPQLQSTIELLSSLTHAVVRTCAVKHEEKVEMLDKLCEVKRQFGVQEPVGEPT